MKKGAIIAAIIGLAVFVLAFVMGGESLPPNQSADHMKKMRDQKAKKKKEESLNNNTDEDSESGSKPTTEGQ